MCYLQNSQKRVGTKPQVNSAHWYQMRGVTGLAILSVFLLSVLLVGEATAKKSNMATKGKWPELLGKTGEEAKAAILKDRPTLSADNIQIIPDDSMMTMDFREDRVRILVNSEGKVTKAPMIG